MSARRISVDLIVSHIMVPLRAGDIGFFSELREGRGIRGEQFPDVLRQRYLADGRTLCTGPLGASLARGERIAQIRTPFRAPKANSIAERWVRSARQECLDHTFIVGESHLRRVLAEYVAYFN